MTSYEYDEVYAARQIKRSRNPLRRFVKGFYLRDLLKDVVGPTIDFGCGAGQLLARLPEKSIGLEVNAALVKHLKRNKMNVQLYDPDLDRLSFASLKPNLYQTFVMSHVLEHFEDAAEGLRQILSACKRLGVRRVIVPVTVADCHSDLVACTTGDFRVGRASGHCAKGQTYHRDRRHLQSY